jgi:hypothetical protein
MFGSQYDSNKCALVRGILFQTTFAFRQADGVSQTNMVI